MAKRHWTDEQLKKAVKKSHSVSDVLRILGTTSRSTVLKRIKALELNLDRLDRSPSGLKMDKTPNAYWRRFKQRLDNYDQVPVQDWKDEQFLGYIFKKYKDYMGVEFSLSYSGTPSKCRELRCTRRTLLALGTEKGEVVKQYIDWVFDTIIIPRKTALSSIAFFFTTNIVLKFKQELRKLNTITRTTILPENLQGIISKFPGIKTYGDLAFAKTAMENDPDDEELYFKLFQELKQSGFDDSILKTIK